MKDIRAGDLPSYSWIKNTRDDILFNFTMEAADKAHEASAIILHTFCTLEQDLLDALSYMFPNLFYDWPSTASSESSS